MKLFIMAALLMAQASFSFAQTTSQQMACNNIRLSTKATLECYQSNAPTSQIMACSALRYVEDISEVDIIDCTFSHAETSQIMTCTNLKYRGKSVKEIMSCILNF
jgi:hypothetical protein